MPDPEPHPDILFRMDENTDTNEKYNRKRRSENRIMYPPGHSPCVEGNIYQDRKKLNYSFLRSFFVLTEMAVSFFLLYRKVKKGKLYGKAKNWYSFGAGMGNGAGVSCWPSGEKWQGKSTV